MGTYDAVSKIGGARWCRVVSIGKRHTARLVLMMSIITGEIEMSKMDPETIDRNTHIHFCGCGARDDESAVEKYETWVSENIDQIKAYLAKLGQL